jgi:hypothetical protein
MSSEIISPGKLLKNTACRGKNHLGKTAPQCVILKTVVEKEHGAGVSQGIFVAARLAARNTTASTYSKPDMWFVCGFAPGEPEVALIVVIMNRREQHTEGSLQPRY